MPFRALAGTLAMFLAATGHAEPEAPRAPASALPDGAALARGATSGPGPADVRDASAGAPHDVAAGEPQPARQWSTRMGTLSVGADGGRATFSNLQATCGAFRLTMALTVAAEDVSQCLGAGDARHVVLELAAGQVVTSSATPDDAKGRCVTAALGEKLQGLTCALEADVSR